MRQEIEAKIKSMPYMKIDYINNSEVGIICTYACLRAERLEELKKELGLKDLCVTWVPTKNYNIGGMVLIGKF